jgi:hypothetical protein
MIGWDYRWWESIEEDWVSPYENNKNDIRFTYWWEDMRPHEVKQLIKEAYESGYERGGKELEGKIEKLSNEILRLQEGIECHVARPGEGTYECNVNDPCPACRLRQAEEILGKREKKVGKLIRSGKILKKEQEEQDE